LHSLLRLHQVQPAVVSSGVGAEAKRRLEVPRQPAAGQGLAAE
jgi:hypothetical protein